LITSHGHRARPLPLVYSHCHGQLVQCLCIPLRKHRQMTWKLIGRRSSIHSMVLAKKEYLKVSVRQCNGMKQEMKKHENEETSLVWFACNFIRRICLALNLPFSFHLVSIHAIFCLL
jgi:hypothetical protein